MSARRNCGGASMARAFGVEVEEIRLTERREIRASQVSTAWSAACYLTKDGQGDPANIALAMAKGARMRGAKVLEGVKVTGVTTEDGRATGVTTAQREDRSRFRRQLRGHVGPRSRPMAGVNVPLQACEHFYIVTEAIPG